MIDERTRNRSRTQFLLLVALFTAPVIAAWVAWQYMGTHGASATTNTGTLIEPARQLDGLPLTTLGGRRLTEDYLRGRWTYVIFAPSDGCGEVCQRQIFHTRQIRTRVNKDMDRVQRLLVMRDPPSDDLAQRLQREHEDLQLAVATSQGWPRLAEQFRLEAEPRSGRRLFLVDPLGNLMMAYPPGVAPKGVLKDLRKLLKVSQIG